MFERYGSEQIRNSASLGGNLGSASPIGDSLPVLIALDSKIVIQGKKQRTVSLDDYFISYRKTKLKKAFHNQYQCKNYRNKVCNPSRNKSLWIDDLTH